MKIMMIPGERNEELILKVHEATVAYHDDDREDFEYDEYRDVMDDLIDEYGLEAMFDAEASDNGQKKESKMSYTVLDEDTIEVTVVAEYVEDIAKKVHIESNKKEAENQ